MKPEHFILLLSVDSWPLIMSLPRAYVNYDIHIGFSFWHYLLAEPVPSPEQ